MKFKSIIYSTIAIVFLTTFAIIFWQKNRYMPIGNKSILDKNTGKIYTVNSDEQIEIDVLNKTKKTSQFKRIK